MESRALITPPRLASWLLDVTLPTADGEAIAGDLCEEFQEVIVPARGARVAQLWFWWQVARSLAPLFFRSWQRASVTRASIALVGAAVVATIPATALITVRAFALSQVPLKTTSEMSPLFLVALVVVLSVTGLLGFAIGIRLLLPPR